MFCSSYLAKTTLVALILFGVSEAGAKQKPEDNNRGRRQTSAKRLMIIDAHSHTEFTGKLNNRGIPVTEEQYFDVPVVFHTGDTSSKRAKLKYADPLTIDEVAVDHQGQVCNRSLRQPLDRVSGRGSVQESQCLG